MPTRPVTRIGAEMAVSGAELTLPSTDAVRHRTAFRVHLSKLTWLENTRLRIGASLQALHRRTLRSPVSRLGPRHTSSRICLGLAGLATFDLSGGQSLQVAQQRTNGPAPSQVGRRSADSRPAPKSTPAWNTPISDIPLLADKEFRADKKDCTQMC